MIAAAALGAATRRLADAGLDDPGRDARRLLAYALGIAPDRLSLHVRDTLSHTAQATFEAAIGARLARQPVSQIVGGREFWGRRFVVTDAVLDPRPETETLVAAALEAPFEQVLDLGTGSGCILLSLLAERPTSTGLGVDASAEALEVASRNAVELGLEGRSRLVQSDWFANVAETFDLVVSNPPYIALHEMGALQPEVREHEPRMALTDEGDGLGAYRAICAGVSPHLSSGGRLLLEIGPTQGHEVSALMRGAGLISIKVIRDLDGRDRVVCGRTPA